MNSVHNRLRRRRLIVTYTNWTVENLTELAKQFKRKIDFQNRYGGGYAAAKRLGIWGEISSHMETDQKRNIVYLAQVIDSDFPRLYKVGLSSDGRIIQRIYENRSRSGFDLRIIRFTKINCDAGKLEKEILSIGTKVDQETKKKLGRFSGYTEYVFMSEEQIAKCHKTLDQYAI